VGGVSDGTNGCAALDYRRDGVRARKAWFFHGDTIVCLGAGISGTNLTTTVNQCLSRGPVRARVDGREVTCADGVLESGKVEWVEHDGTRYAFPKAQRVVISNRRQTGNWSRVYHSAAAPREDVTTPVFCLWVDHGRSPTNASYAYAIQPAGEEVLVNNEQLQAVRFADGSVQAVFWEPGKLQNIEVDQPSVVMLNGRCFRVADPTQKLGELTVTLDGKPKRVTLAGGRSSEVKFP
jgi:chondroitin AC lyase